MVGIVKGLNVEIEMFLVFDSGKKFTYLVE